MLQSMTGFARSSVAAGPVTVTVELRSVNSRYLDLHFKMPDGLRALEPDLRQRIARRLSRGKVEIMVRSQAQSSHTAGINQQRLDTLIAAATTISQQLATAAAIDPVSLLLAPGVLDAEELAPEALLSAVSEGAEAALVALCEQRHREGVALAATISERAQAMRNMLGALRENLPALREQQRQRLLDRIAEAGISPDERRLEEELVYAAQRADVAEEMDRVDAHLDAIEQALASGQPCGRKLDFLMQELNREANTLSSKSTALGTTNTAVEFKLLIEQMREQVQNLE